jgi:hypothetical protein
MHARKSQLYQDLDALKQTIDPPTEEEATKNGSVVQKEWIDAINPSGCLLYSTIIFNKTIVVHSIESGCNCILQY